jgi:UDP-N-acetylglucosamine 2-epimerase (non-hydrolysing)/UDP-GlcNAc3NAcA epimerase
VRILTVVGNRPQFIKAAAVSGRLRERHDEVLVHTGQHHDDALSAVFFSELGLAEPDRQLSIAGGSNTSQTARMLSALEPIVAESDAGAVLVYGDTNSTLAGALAAAGARRPVIHVEAGMRSFDRAMPEELNRVLVDHVADLLLCPSHSAAANLAAEGIGVRQPSAGAEAKTPQVSVVGDVMVDVAMQWQPRAAASGATLDALGVRPGGFLVLTAHRAGNVDVPERLATLVALTTALAADGSYGPIVLPLHPRTRKRLDEAGLRSTLEGAAGVHVTEPLSYAAFSALVCQARAVLTDSGGVQKEAYLAGVPCLTLRDTTEWVETVQTGWNTLVDLDRDAIAAALGGKPPAERPPLYGDGHAAERCVEAIDTFVAERGIAGSQ